jgi:hypothetical protein
MPPWHKLSMRALPSIRTRPRFDNKLRVTCKAGDARDASLLPAAGGAANGAGRLRVRSCSAPGARRDWNLLALLSLQRLKSAWVSDRLFFVPDLCPILSPFFWRKGGKPRTLKCEITRSETWRSEFWQMGIFLIHGLVTVGSRRFLWACIQPTESGFPGGCISLYLAANGTCDADIPLIVR